jgi:hypothetical protein
MRCGDTAADVAVDLFSGHPPLPVDESAQHGNAAGAEQACEDRASGRAAAEEVRPALY